MNPIIIPYFLGQKYWYVTLNIYFKTFDWSKNSCEILEISIWNVKKW